MNSTGNFFISGQITLGLYPYYTWEDKKINPEGKMADFRPQIGFTIGKRIYWNNKKKHHFTYYDGQISAIFIGAGFGLILNQQQKYNKYKIFFGSAFPMFTYDYINFEKGKHHLNAGMVLPISTQLWPKIKLSPVPGY